MRLLCVVIFMLMFASSVALADIGDDINANEKIEAS